MTLGYNLYLQSNLEPLEVLTAAAASVGIEKVHEEIIGWTKKNVASGPGVWISTGNAGEVKEDLIKETYEIEVQVDINFEIDKFNREEGRLTMLKVVGAVLRQHSGDALLLFYGETGLLLRKDSQLYLDQQSGFWNTSHLAKLDLPYSFSSLPVM